MCTMVASQFVYVTPRPSLFASTPWYRPARCTLMHDPWPEHRFGHAIFEHARPVKPSMHVQRPVARSHVPAFEHSASGPSSRWAVPLKGLSAQAAAFSHARPEQSGTASHPS